MYVSALIQAGRGDITVVGGRYGLASKDTTPSSDCCCIKSFAEQSQEQFTIGIIDDVSATLYRMNRFIISYPSQRCVRKIWGLAVMVRLVPIRTQHDYRAAG